MALTEYLELFVNYKRLRLIVADLLMDERKIFISFQGIKVGFREVVLGVLDWDRLGKESLDTLAQVQIFWRAYGHPAG